MKTDRLQSLRVGEKLSGTQLLILIIQLSIPAVLAQLSTTIMEYIDASMVGHLGANESASIGLVSSSTWLFGGICMAVSIGFTVQIAHSIGAGEEKKARSIVRQGLLTAIVISLVLVVIGVLIHSRLPVWLGAEEEIRRDASRYFLIFSLMIPAVQINSMASGMLQCSGNMKIPSILQIVMCGLNVCFNFLLIFPSRSVTIAGMECSVWGAGLGVAGAALGTAMAESVTALLLLYFLLVRSQKLRLRRGERLKFSKEIWKTALRIGIPVAFEQGVTCGAYIMFTRIVSPLGTIAIAANSFAITTEGVCYMPGYGIGSAATTLIGQSIGARRRDLTRKLGWMTTGLGMLVMAGMGCVMFVFAPWMIGLLTPDADIRELGAMVLRIEAFAEPMYAASIVASGVFRGAGDTIVPSSINFISMWCVRLPLALGLSHTMGLRGVWIAMCIELCIRGALFLILLGSRRWKRKAEA